MFHPHTDKDREEMFKEIGIDSIEQLFDYIPEDVRFPTLDLPRTHTEMEAFNKVCELQRQNEKGVRMPSFLGAGAYQHFVPAAVDAIISRSEFYSAYTPYQPEISQGTLQTMFEYQTHIINLTGMEVSNASHYDGATAAAEAVNMGQTIFRKKRKKVIISPGIHPHYRDTIRTYNAPSDLVIVGDDTPVKEGPEALIPMIDQDTSLVMVQYPDFFGRIYDYTELGKAVHEAGGLLVMVINPMALGLIKPPSDFGADIVCGEGQPLGIPVSYGGPYLGILATKKEYVRSIAGRLVGETVDQDGKRGYVLTLSTREQHIKRERARSNICSNQGLMTLAATVYLTLLGKEGLKEAANLCYQNAHYAAAEINKIDGFELWNGNNFFHEFAVKCPIPANEVNKILLDNEIVGGFEIGTVYDGMDDYLLIAVTETNTKEGIDKLVKILGEVA
jgi:glycine dehydrogenase subunit 1